MKKLRITILAVAVFALCVIATARAQNVVNDWDGIASTTIVANAKQPPAASSVWFAYVHLAVYDAVNAIDRQHQPYLFTTKAPVGASKDAAAVAAAHDVLVHYFPSQQSSLDSLYASSIAGISDTPANVGAGQSIGQASAAALIAERANDGLFANVPYTPPVGPGFWQPTPPAFAAAQTPWLGRMNPFTMKSADQFLPRGPTPLDSSQWMLDYNEVKALGELNSGVRTAQQTEIALFWTEHPGQQYARAFQGLATQQQLDTPDTARMMAMLWSGFADAAIGCFNAKYTYSFWRPVTAIPLGGGNPLLVADPNWTPLAPTPNHPEYPSAHGCASSSVSTILAGYFGTPVIPFSVDSLVTNTTHTFNDTHDLIGEVANARIYGGIHYRNSVDDGALLGKRVGEQLLRRYFKPVRQPNHKEESGHE